MGAIANMGVFPGHSEADLKRVWAENSDDAQRFYNQGYAELDEEDEEDDGDDE